MGLCQKMSRPGKKLAINAARDHKALPRATSIRLCEEGVGWGFLERYCTTTQLPSGCRQGTSYGVCELGSLGGWGEDFLKGTATFPQILTATNPPSNCRRLARNRPHDFHRRKSLRRRVQGRSESMVVHEETSLNETWFFRFQLLTISTGFELLISHWNQEQLFGWDDRTHVVNHFKRKKKSLLRLIS